MRSSTEASAAGNAGKRTLFPPGAGAALKPPHRHLTAAPPLLEVVGTASGAASAAPWTASETKLPLERNPKIERWSELQREKTRL